MDAKAWEQISLIALNRVAEHFSPKEITVISDFICTAKKDISAVIEEIKKE